MPVAGLRVLVADDERPARRFLVGVLRTIPEVEVVGEATTGNEAIALIEELKPDLALLDLSMPDRGGLEAARLLQSGAMPLIAFVTAYDEFAVQAFELNAVDYLLKPVERERLAATVDRARSRLSATPAVRTTSVAAAATTLEMVARRLLERIPVKRRDETVIIPVRQVASIVAERELLHLTTFGNERYTISYRLHALEARLDPRRFVRLSRGALVAVDAIQRFSPMPGGLYEVQLSNGQSLTASRIHSRALRDGLLRL
jgi:two-component system, LytTR family, response regulator